MSQKRPQKFLLFPVLCTILFVSLSRSARAVPLPNNEAKNVPLPAYPSFNEILLTVLQALLSVAFVIAVVFAVISGYRFIISQGNQQRVYAAKQSLLWTVLGIAVIALAWVILTLVVYTVQTGQP